jgi:hypothetical protein
MSGFAGQPILRGSVAIETALGAAMPSPLRRGATTALLRRLGQAMIEPWL